MNIANRAAPEDKVYLMNAAIGVVLRRDVSLNRRVNTWLLGSLDESSDARVAFYKKHSLKLLTSTLRVGIGFAGVRKHQTQSSSVVDSNYHSLR